MLFSYTANFKEEVSLQEGEIVTGIRKDRNGWMYGRKNRTNEVGHFPAVYVEVATQVSCSLRMRPVMTNVEYKIKNHM